MAIKVGEKDSFPYLGDYGPVSIYKGEQKLAGYKWAEKSGRELHFDNTYNSHVEVEVDGQSYQHAEPTPDNPIEIESVNDFDVVSSVEKLSEGQLQEYDYGVEYESVDKINISLSEPLRSVGDVKDRIYRDVNDGLWKVERNVGEDVLDGNRGWVYRDSFSNETKDSYELSIGTINSKKLEQISSNMFIGTKSRYPEVGHIRLDVVASTMAGWLTFSVTKGLFGSLADMKNHLNENNLIVHFQLANPTTETLVQELQDQLNTLKSFKDSNYIYTVLQDDDLTPTIHAKTEVKDI